MGETHFSGPLVITGDHPGTDLDSEGFTITGPSSSGGNVTLEAPSGHLLLQSGVDGKQPRINSRNFTQTSGDSIGFQSKPAQTVSSSGTVIGAQISPRLNDAVALTGSGSIIGLHVDAYLKGDSGNIAGDVRGVQIELVDDNSSGRTVAGDICAVRVRNNLSCAVTGDFSVIRVDAKEGSLGYEALFDLPDDAVLADAGGGTVGSAASGGFIRVIVGGTPFKLQLYADS